MDKPIMVYPFTGILLGSEKEQTTATRDSMDESEKHRVE